MADIEHNTLTDPELHEPKGVSTASAGQAYVANGSGSGSWQSLHPHVGGYVSFDAAGPAYSHSATTSDTVLNPTYVITDATEFTGASSPNARLIYTGSEDRHAFLSFNASIKQAGGADRDIEFVFYQSGAALEGSRAIRTTTTGSWGSIAVNFDSILSTNDYIEVYIKSSVAVTVDFAQAYLGIIGVPD